MIWVKRIGVALIALVVVAALAWTVASRPISEAIFRMAVSQLLVPPEKAPDGLHVYLCGTGSPLPDPTRSGPCMGILAGDRAFVVDPGEGGARKLATMGFPLGKTEAVILSHLHSDHIDGLGGILIQAWVVGGRDTPLPIYGPEGVQRVVAGVNEMFAVDSVYRNAHHGSDVANLSGYGGEAKVMEAVPFKMSTALDEGGVRITSTLVSHAPVHPALGLRFDYGGRAVSFSGDSLYDPRFVELSQGVDLMLHDAMQHRMIGVMQERAAELMPESPAVKILHDIVDYHASPEDAARAAADAGAGELVLTHVAPALPTSLLYPAFLGDAADLFDGEITVAEDGMVFSYEVQK